MEGETVDPLTNPNYQPRVLLEQMADLCNPQPAEPRSRYDRLLKVPQRFVCYIRAVFDSSDTE